MWIPSIPIISAPLVASTWRSCLQEGQDLSVCTICCCSGILSKIFLLNCVIFFRRYNLSPFISIFVSAAATCIHLIAKQQRVSSHSTFNYCTPFAMHCYWCTYIIWNTKKKKKKKMLKIFISVSIASRSHNLETDSTVLATRLEASKGNWEHMNWCKVEES